MMEDEQSSSEQFAEIVHGLDIRPLHLRVLDWFLVLVIMVATGVLVGMMLGACAWIWLTVVGKF